jgi:hypothetical protein
LDQRKKKDYSEHIESIIKRLTLEEKIAQMTWFQVSWLMKAPLWMR